MHAPVQGRVGGHHGSHHWIHHHCIEPRVHRVEPRLLVVQAFSASAPFKTTSPLLPHHLGHGHSRLIHLRLGCVPVLILPRNTTVIVDPSKLEQKKKGTGVLLFISQIKQTKVAQYIVVVPH